ncbi:MAG: hypothetical protein KF773_06990 [Deltaproteobacteria bacterium]|nr:hypothetical protein [Deltaproteobacteria bacterium]MCW5802214.1 hypothetical protein [Deltaproteobacteria bacterium]
MALRTILVPVALIAAAACAACGGSSSSANEPQTAKEKQALEAQEEGTSQNSRKWGGWRYKGDRTDCFFVVGRQCFKTEAQACAAARCPGKKKCTSSGAGPATIACK